jgi:hypothetical protein
MPLSAASTTSSLDTLGPSICNTFTELQDSAKQVLGAALMNLPPETDFRPLFNRTAAAFSNRRRGRSTDSQILNACVTRSVTRY